MKQLASHGKDVKVRQGDPNTPEIEDHLVMETAMALTNNIFFFNSNFTVSEARMNIVLW